MKVLKFGGTSLKNAEKFLLVTNIINNYLKKEKIAVVLSAPATITNSLELIIKKKLEKKNAKKDFIYIKNFFINLINNLKERVNDIDIIFLHDKIKKILSQIKELLHGIKLINYCPDIIKAKILSQGEKFSILLLESLLKIKKHKIYIISPKKYLLAYGNNLESTVDISITSKNIQKINLSNIDLILMPGFFAVNKNNNTVLLGRNGSDYSAAVLAVCLKASCCEIWTDVNGIYTADPNIIPDTQLLKFINYQEAINLSYFGAKVIHYKTLLPMLKNNIPCVIKNIMNPQFNGTLIKNFDITKYLSPKIKGIVELKNISMLNIFGNKNKYTNNIISKILFFIFQSKISIYFITQSSEDCNINIFLLNKDLDNLKSLLEEELYLEFKYNLIKSIQIIRNLSLITLVINKVNYSKNIISNFLKIFKITKTSIFGISQNISQNYITVAIKKYYAQNIIKIIHEILFHKKKILEIFIIGTGGIGSTLLQQIHQNIDFFKKKNIILKICSILNTKYLLIDFNGINIKNWQEQIKHNYSSNNKIQYLLHNIKKYKLINPVIIDCTSSQEIADQYINFFNYGFNIIAVNKKANSSSIKYYNQIRLTASKLNLKFYYETNVGAGLPIINTLKNLLQTGNKLNKFIGILSGSLSFIFGKLEEGITLSKSIIMAQKMGFTEPDPRIDLTGIDVARKLLILAREIGFNIELKDIIIESIIPNKFKLNQDSSIKEFLNSLSKIDEIYIKKVQYAKQNNKVLRYVGSIDKKGICKVEIIQIDNNHPFFNIKNGENSFAFYTNYYQPYPLVLRGYGAGNNVTAAGVLTDLLHII
ncbi:bifunctional aspartate kinase/homoserine dehydrogenase I [Enterobacteriaceae endosymbiont of Donacia cincticornis]|uniref:bifunctional aspartate kinase/homoserine dehydrogenase I n=1 Tax=Enterobacteriaceae endosymbiont of Donacia cincticornis TaxID=2675773 RepID=UPI001449B0B7|nr:bifunctional aspartate kinase/homoserine dehydrogenase I [Enterobacteriaceae endosymbiont of Donacia cincticornis]QJC36245.1 bifunctional aspartate kinase/homoserine dehydrogenase I [Enterobacteriaceae endosymbiont of Donacia cincticornis]